MTTNDKQDIKDYISESVVQIRFNIDDWSVQKIGSPLTRTIHDLRKDKLTELVMENPTFEQSEFSLDKGFHYTDDALINIKYNLQLAENSGVLDNQKLFEKEYNKIK